MPRFQKNGRSVGTARITKKTVAVVTKTEQQTNNNNQAQPNPANINKTIQQVQGGAASDKLDSMVSNAVGSTRKLQKFIKFNL